MKLTKDSALRFRAAPSIGVRGALKALVEVPTVSADPAHKADIERGAELAAATLREFGAAVQALPRAGRQPRPSRRPWATIPRGPPSPSTTTWTCSPPRRRRSPGRASPSCSRRQGDKYLGRGTTDDKGPALAALYGAKAALEAGVPVNIHFLWELEEEIGSPHFAATLKTMKDAARTDSVVVSDTVWVSRGQPSISSGLRGLQRFTFTLETAATDEHSGTTGGAARNPVAELCQLAAEMHDARTGA